MELPEIQPWPGGRPLHRCGPVLPLTHKAEMLAYQPQAILAGRRINDGMGKFMAEQTIMAGAGLGILVGWMIGQCSGYRDAP